MKNLEKKIIAILKKAGIILLHSWRNKKANHLSYKKYREVVSQADFASDTFIRREIKKRFPQHQIISEEEKISEKEKQKRLKSDWLWIVDPLDGTNNFVAGSPLFSINLALALKGELQLGFIYLPVTKDLYLARKKHGAFLNSQPIHVSQIKNLKEAGIIFCHGYTPADSLIQSKLYSLIHPQASFCRMWGSAGIEFGAVAAGGMSAFIFTGSKMWDIAAGVLLVQEAGGKITDPTGQAWQLGSKTKDNILIASNGLIHQKLLTLIKAAY
jgi:myo-inositol-1(or 4)-monophosphatase